MGKLIWAGVDLQEVKHKGFYIKKKKQFVKLQLNVPYSKVSDMYTLVDS